VHIEAEALVDSLRERGLRLTAPRRAVCSVLATAHDQHLTAAELGERVEQLLGRAVDPATIYRTIDILEQAGHVHHVHFGHGAGVVHLVEESNHHHLVCERCGRTEDVPMEDLSGLLTGLERRYGFRAGNTHFALLGRCRTCRQAVP
jgi:Fur family ferric uptake transcriptional regulator